MLVGRLELECYDADHLLTQRDKVSREIRNQVRPRRTAHAVRDSRDT